MRREEKLLQVRDTLLRIFWGCVGIAFLSLALIGRDPHGHEVSLWRRAVVFAGGLFFLYVGLMYYLPKYRKQRAELDRFIEEAEREDEAERKANEPPQNSAEKL